MSIIKNIRDEQEEPNENRLNPSDFLVPQGVVIPEPESVFSINGIPVFTKGSISTIAGAQKAGKTTVLAWIVAQCIRGYLNVLWIDTEQGKYYASRTQFWLLKIAGMHTCDNLKYLDLRTITPPQRLEVIGSAIEMYSPDMVIIDGVRDVMYDINNTEETQIIITQLLKWSEIYNCHIVNILHFNKGRGNDVLRGHIGTEIQNKAETVIKVYKDDAGLIIAEPQDTRSEPFEAMAFQRDSYGLPMPVDRVASEIGQRSHQATDLTIEQHREIVEIAFQGSDEGMSYSMMQDAISAAYNLHGIAIGINKSRSYIAHLVQQNVLGKTKNGTKTIYSIKH